MRRLSLRMAFALLVVVLAGLAILLGLLRREPATYREISIPAGPERRALSGEFSSRVQRLIDTVSTNGEDHWAMEFTANQMNSYFEEDFPRVKPFEMPDGVGSPRVAIEPGRMCMAFRYGEGFWSSIVTLEVNVWLVANEVNTVAVEVIGLRAGVVPIAIQSFLERVSEQARRVNLEVTWHRRDGRPVAIVRHQSDRPNPAVVLHRMELQHGRVIIEGKSTELGPIRTGLSMIERHHP